MSQQIHRFLYRNRVHVAEQCFDQFQKPKLQRKAFRVFALEIKPADIVRFPRGYVRQHRDHSDAAQSQQGKDLVVVSGIDGSSSPHSAAVFAMALTFPLASLVATMSGCFASSAYVSG